MSTRALSLLLQILLPCALFAAPGAEGEPTYHGKTLKEWTELAKDKDPAIRRKAVVHLGLGPFGKAAVPALMAALADEEVEVSQAAVTALRRMGRDAEKAVQALAAMLQETNRVQAREICGALGQIGPAAVPVLIEILNSKEEDTRQDACLALANIGAAAKDAVPALVAEMKNKQSPHFARHALEGIGKAALTLELFDAAKDSKTCGAAMSVIEEVGPIDNIGVPILIQLLRDPNADISREALFTLSRLGRLPKESIPALIEILGHEKCDSSAEARLRQIGKPAVPYLIKALEHRSERIRVAARRTLDQIQPRSINELVQALKEGDQEARIQALSALEHYAPDPRPALGAFKLAMEDKEAEVRRRCIETLTAFNPTEDVISALAAAAADPVKAVRKDAVSSLGNLGSDSKQALQPLMKALRDPDCEIRLSAVHAIDEIGACDKRIIEALRGAFSDPHALVRREAFRVVGRQGQRAKDELPSLSDAMANNTGSVRVEAALALWRVARIKSVVPSLVQILDDRNAHSATRARAARALKSIGPDAKDAIPALVNALSFANQDLREAVIEALGAIGPDAKEAVPILLNIFARKDLPDRLGHDLDLDAGDALARIGKPAVSAMIEALQSPDHPNSAYAYRVLAEIGSDAKASVPALIERLYDESDRARELSAQTLGMIGREARSAIPALVDALRDREKRVRSAAAVALEGVGPDVRGIGALQEALNDSNAGVRQNAATALGSFGPASRSAATELHKIMKDPDPQLRAAAALALWRVERDKKAMLPAFKELVKEKDPSARATAAEGLWEAGRDIEGLRLLIATLQMENRTKFDREVWLFIGDSYWNHVSPVRIRAASALERFSPEAEEIVLELRKVQKLQRSSRESLVTCILARIDGQFAEELGLPIEELTQPLEKAYRYYRRPGLERLNDRYYGIICFSSHGVVEVTDENEDIDDLNGTILPPKRLRPRYLQPAEETPDEPVAG